MAIDIGSAVAYLDMNTEGFAKGITTSLQALDQFNKGTASVGTTMQSVGNSLSSAGASMTAKVTVPIVGAGAAIVKTSADFEKGMSNVSAISGAAGSDLEDLKAKAMEMGSKTKFSASEAADAFSYMAMAGWKTQDMMSGIDGIMNLAAASGEDLAKTSDIVTDALTAFGLSAQDSGHFADVLAAASSNANTNVGMLGESFKYCAPVCGAMGYSAEDASIALGLMANSGIKAGSAGNVLKNAISNMASPTDAMAGIMAQYNLSLTNADGSMKSLAEVMDMLRNNMKRLTDEQVNQQFDKYADSLGMTRKELESLSEEEQAEAIARGVGLPMIQGWTQEQKNSALATRFSAKEIKAMTQEQRDYQLACMVGQKELYGLSEAEQASAASTLFGKESMSGMLAVINATEGDYNKLSDAIYNADGSAQKMADTMNDNLAGQVTILKSTLESLCLQLGEALVPKIKGVVQGIQDFVSWLTSLDQGTKTSVVSFGLMAAAIGPVMFIIGKLISTVGVFVELFTTVSTLIAEAGGAMALLTNPITIVIASIMGIIAVLKLLWDYNENFRNAMINVWDRIKATISNALDSIMPAIGSLKDGIGKILQALTPIIAIVGGVLVYSMSIAIGAINGFISAIGDIIDIVADVINAVGEFALAFESLIAGDFSGAGEHFKNFFLNLVYVVKDAFDAILDFVSGFFDGFIGTLQTIFDFAGINIDLTGLWQSLQNSVTSFFDWLLQSIIGLPMFIAEGVDAFSEWLVESVSSIVEMIIQSVDQFSQWIVDFVVNFPENFVQMFNTVVQAVTAWAAQMITTAIMLGSQFVTSLMQFFNELPANIGYVIGLVLGSIAAFVVNMVNKAIELGTNFLNSIIQFFIQLPTKIAEFVTAAHVAVTTWVSQMITSAIMLGTNFLNSIIQFFTQLPGKINEFVTGAYNAVVAWAAQMIQKAIETGTNFINNIVSFFSQLPGKVMEFANQVISSLVSWVTGMSSKGTEAGQSLSDSLTSILTGIPGKLGSIGSNIVEGLWNGISSAIGWFNSKVSEFASGILDGMKSALDIHSPSRKTYEIGEYFSQGLGNGIFDAKDDLIAKVKDMCGALVDFELDADNPFMKFLMEIESVVSNIKDDIGEFITMLTQDQYQDMLALSVAGTQQEMIYDGMINKKEQKDDKTEYEKEQKDDGEKIIVDVDVHIDKVEVKDEQDLEQVSEELTYIVKKKLKK